MGVYIQNNFLRVLNTVRELNPVWPLKDQCHALLQNKTAKKYCSNNNLLLSVNVCTMKYCRDLNSNNSIIRVCSVKYCYNISVYYREKVR